MSKLVKIKDAEVDNSYFVEVESRNYGRASQFDGYQTFDPEKDELTQILSYIVDRDWETASTSEACFMLLREKIEELLGEDFKDTKSFHRNLDSLVAQICFLTRDSIIGIKISDDDGFYKLKVSDEEMKEIFKSWQ